MTAQRNGTGTPVARRNAFDAAALDYFAARAIDTSVALELGVHQDGRAIVFPYVATDGARFERARLLAPGPAKVRQPAGVPLTAWWPCGRPHGVPFALVCEGESDALAAISVLRALEGAPAWLTRLPVAAAPGTGYPADRLADDLADAGVEQAWLAFDGDDAGRGYTAKVVVALADRGVRPFAVDLADGNDLATALAAVDARRRGEWLANLLVDTEAAAPAPAPPPGSTTPPAVAMAARATLRRLDVGRMVREEPPAVPWVVEGLVVRGALTVLNGREGTGKSLLTMALAAGVATGQDEAGVGCTQGGVVIVDAENGSYEIHRRVRTLDLPADVDVFEADGFDLRTALDELGAVLEEHRPALLVLDSFRSLWRGDENDSREVAAALDPLRNLVRRHDVGAILLHHSGKGVGAAYRGSSAIGASAELGFSLARADDDSDRARRYLECWKCRPAPEPGRRWLRLAVEGGRVYVDQAEAPDGEQEQQRAAAAPVRDELRPRVLAALSAEPKARADIARACGREPKDRSVGRVLDALASEGLAAKHGPDGRPKWRLSQGGSDAGAPMGAGHPATLPVIPVTERPREGGEAPATWPPNATTGRA